MGSEGPGTLTGYTALVEELALPVPRPHTESRIAGAVRRSEVRADRVFETYPRKSAPAQDLRGHLLFALKNEPTDLRVLAAAFKRLGPDPVRAWVRSEPTGGYARKAWFLYEFLTGDRLDVPNARTGNYVDVLDPERHITAARRTSARHRVWDNLLGVPGFAPTVRRTARLTRRMQEALDKEAAALTQRVDPALVRRAVSYLYTKETRSSFEIEGEQQHPGRETRFVAALAEAARFDPGDKPALLALQNSIVDPRYAAADWRTAQNYIGQTVSGYREVVHFVCPKPDDVPSLMAAWTRHAQRLLAASIDPVVAAALISFGFDFIHPFEDGNGRIHRFLIHHVLVRTGFSPKDMIFPVSIAILRDMQGYDAALETFSRPLLSLIDWRFTESNEMVVAGETADHYRYFDATPLAEYLYDRVAETVREDLAKELRFLGAYDRAYRGVRDVVDMPNRRISLLVRLVMANGGRLAKAKRSQFEELSDAEIAAMETAVRDAMREESGPD